MTIPISRPSDPSVSSFDFAAHNGALLLVRVNGYEPKIVTRFDPMGKPAIRCDVAVLDGSMLGATYDDVLWFGAALVRGLSGHVGEYVAGRLAQGQATGGNTPPWVLSSPTDEELRAAADYLARRGPAAASPPPSARVGTPVPDPWATSSAASSSAPAANDQPPF